MTMLLAVLLTMAAALLALAQGDPALEAGPAVGPVPR